MEVIEIKGNLHLYEVDIIPFYIEEIMDIIHNNGIHIVFKRDCIDSLESIKMNFTDFLNKYKNKEVYVEGDGCFYSGKLEE